MRFRTQLLTVLFLLIVSFSAITASATPEMVTDDPEQTFKQQDAPQITSPSSLQDQTLPPEMDESGPANPTDPTDPAVPTDQTEQAGKEDAIMPCTRTEGCVLLENHEGACSTPNMETIEPAMTAAEFAGLLQRSSVMIDKDVFIDTSVTIPSETMVTVSGGTIVILEGATLINDGFLQINGGQLIVDPGAILSNNMFLLVNEQGSILLEENASYVNAPESALLLDRSAPGATANIDGISRDLIECTIYAPDANTLCGLLTTEGYRMLTIMIDPSLDMSGISLPDHVALAAR